MTINVSVGDIFMSGSSLYRVTYIQESKNVPDDPYIEVDVWVDGIGWKDQGDIGFLHSEIKYHGLTLFKETEL